MGNYSVYLNSSEAKKVNNVSLNCRVPKNQVLRIMLLGFNEQYLTELVQHYKEDLNVHN